MQRTLLTALLALAVCLSANGCSQVGAGMLPVKGSVKFADGTPVTGEMATIVFQPVAGNVPAKSASGTINPDGSFELMTSNPGDGAYPGDYKIVLKVWSNYRQQILAVPEDYGSESTTPLSVAVDKSNTRFDFSIDR